MSPQACKKGEEGQDSDTGEGVQPVARSPLECRMVTELVLEHLQSLRVLHLGVAVQLAHVLGHGLVPVRRGKGLSRRQKTLQASKGGLLLLEGTNIAVKVRRPGFVGV